MRVLQTMICITDYGRIDSDKLKTAKYVWHFQISVTTLTTESCDV